MTDVCVAVCIASGEVCTFGAIAMMVLRWTPPVDDWSAQESRIRFLFHGQDIDKFLCSKKQTEHQRNKVKKKKG